MIIGSGWDSVSGFYIVGIEQIVLQFIKYVMILNYKYIDIFDYRFYKLYIVIVLIFRFINCYINVRS